MTTIVVHFKRARSRDRRFSADPSKSPAQHRFMEAVAHDPKFRKRVGVPQKVGEEFTSKDEDPEDDCFDVPPLPRGVGMPPTDSRDSSRRVVEQTRRVADAYRTLEREKAALDAIKPACNC